MVRRDQEDQKVRRGLRLEDLAEHQSDAPTVGWGQKSGHREQCCEVASAKPRADGEQYRSATPTERANCAKPS